MQLSFSQAIPPTSGSVKDLVTVRVLDGSIRKARYCILDIHLNLLNGGHGVGLLLVPYGVEVVSQLQPHTGLPRGVVFIPFHWGDLHGDETAANYLTISAIGRIAKQPEFKYCAVRLAPVLAPRIPVAPAALVRIS